MNYQLITTLGPSSRRPQVWRALIAEGADAFRLNTSHTSLPGLDEWLEDYSSFCETTDHRPPLILDLQGSKWRLGTMPGCVLKNDDEVLLVEGDCSGQSNELPVPHPDFFKALACSPSEVVLNDAKVRLEVVRPQDSGYLARVTQGGPLASCKGITLKASEFRIDSLQQKDAQILERTRNYPNIRFAISYVRDEVEMAEYRHLMGTNSYLIAKIERPTSISCIEQLGKIANEIWICRGDLGAELGLVEMAEAVQGMQDAARGLDVPIMMAGQVLEHMVHSLRPTRSEVCYLLDCLRSGIDGFVLSDEIAIGEHPIQACQVAAMFKK